MWLGKDSAFDLLIFGQKGSYEQDEQGLRNYYKYRDKIKPLKMESRYYPRPIIGSRMPLEPSEK